MISNSIRYVDRTTVNNTSVEISFDGASSDNLRGEDPACTNVNLRIFSKSNIHLEASPWIEVTAKPLGNLPMPSGVWNGIKLSEVIKDRIFVALSNTLSEINPRTGECLWSIDTGNTPIYWIMTTRRDDGLIVFNGYYKFQHPRKLSNIALYSLSGDMKWRSPLPYGDDIFANHPYFDGEYLRSSSWNGFNCIIDEVTGEIASRQFTK